MPTLPDFLRTAPAASVQSFLAARDVEAADIPWKAHHRTWSPKLQQHLGRLTEERQESLLEEVQRIIGMADAEGQAAIYAVLDAETRKILDALENGMARATWLATNLPFSFERAEHVRQNDSFRRGKMWRTYATNPGCSVDSSADAVARFKADLRDQLGTRNVEVDICARTRATLSRDLALTQVTVFREGRSESRKAFIKDKLDRVTEYPVLDSALTYEMATGIIEVVSDDGNVREALVRLLARHILGSPVPGQPIQLRQYTLNKLRFPQEFKHDAADGIEDVRVNRLRLIANDRSADQITLQCARGSGRTIWQMAQERFGDRNPLNSGFTISQASLTVRFKTSIGRAQRSLPITITSPTGCDLKERSNRQRLIGEKYLPLWGLIRTIQ